jgi:hypothetical protein
MRLPSRIAKYGSTRKLFTEISSLISRTTQAGGGVVLPLTFSVFATWLADSLPVAPFAWIVTPPTTTGAPLGQLLGLLCRRAFVVSDISSATTRSRRGRSRWRRPRSWQHLRSVGASEDHVLDAVSLVHLARQAEAVDGHVEAQPAVFACRLELRRLMG